MTTEPDWRRNFLFPSKRFVQSFDCQLQLSKDSDPISIRTIQSPDRHSGLWDAAVVLGAFIFQNKQDFIGKSVLEVQIEKNKKEFLFNFYYHLLFINDINYFY